MNYLLMLEPCLRGFQNLGHNSKIIESIYNILRNCDELFADAQANSGDKFTSIQNLGCNSQTTESIPNIFRNCVKLYAGARANAGAMFASI